MEFGQPPFPRVAVLPRNQLLDQQEAPEPLSLGLGDELAEFSEKG